MIFNVNSLLFMYLEVYYYNVACILCHLIFFVAWLFVCAIVERDQYYASTSPDITKFRQYYYINFNWLCLYYLYSGVGVW